MVQADVNRFAATAELSCNSEYMFEDGAESKTAKCTKDGTWDIQPKCVRK